MPSTNNDAHVIYGNHSNLNMTLVIYYVYVHTGSFFFFTKYLSLVIYMAALSHILYVVVIVIQKNIHNIE